MSPLVGQKLGTLVASVNAADLTQLTALVESGQMTPVIDKTYRLSEVVEAVRYMQAGRARGKVVISIHDDD